MTELLPCPFCGYHSPWIMDLKYDEVFKFAIKCPICTACIANNESEEKIIEAWNRRSSGWISVKDRLPENKQIVLVITEFGEMAVCRTDINTHNYIFMLNDTSLQTKKVTHWMPLPEAPK